MTAARTDRTGSGARAVAGPCAELPETATGSAHCRTAGYGAGLYESFGIAPPPNPSLQLRTAGPSA